MSVCTQCGQPLGVGRFCTNCGHPVDESGPVSEETVIADDWRTDTAERPAVQDVEHTIRRQRPVLPPPVTIPSEAPRFPLYADQVDQVDQVDEVDGIDATRAAPAVLPPDEGTPEAFRHVGERAPRRSVGWVPWAAGAAVMLLVAVLGAWLLLSGDDDSPEATDATASDTADASQEPSETAETQPSNEPTADESSGSGEGGGKGKPEDISRTASASASKTAPPNQDVSGNMVRYQASNMLDGVPETTWRMAGDGTGETLTFQLAGPTTITEVAMINGYAKTSKDGGRTLDWYNGNRRVQEVEWRFDDGSTVTQNLENTRNLQSLKVPKVTTQTVEARIVKVSKPGSGPAGRNYTAVSEVSLFGVPG